MFRPLPVADPHQMTVLATTLSGNPRIWQRLAYPDYQDYRSSAAFSEMAAWDLNSVGLTADGQTDRLLATVVSGNYFSMLRLDPTPLFSESGVLSCGLKGIVPPRSEPGRAPVAVPLSGDLEGV